MWTSNPFIECVNPTSKLKGFFHGVSMDKSQGTPWWSAGRFMLMCIDFFQFVLMMWFWFLLIWNNKTLQKSMFALLGSHLILCWPRKGMNLFKAHPSGHIHAEKSELLHLSEGNKPLIGRDFIGLFSPSVHGTGIFTYYFTVTIPPNVHVEKSWHQH